MVGPELVGPHLDFEAEHTRLNLVAGRRRAEGDFALGYGLKHVGVLLIFEELNHIGVVRVADDFIRPVAERIARVVEDTLEDYVRRAAARDAFLQAEDGFAVELDPELADALGAFTEEALTLQDILEDIQEAQEGTDVGE